LGFALLLKFYTRAGRFPRDRPDGVDPLTDDFVGNRTEWF
jgi:hypothetical protein